MKVGLHKVLALTIVALVGFSVMTPADARWYDGRHWHVGHAPAGWIWDPHLHYYIAGPAPAVVVAPPVVVAAPPPAPPVVIAQPAPAAVVVTRPAYVAPAPGLSIGVNIR